MSLFKSLIIGLADIRSILSLDIPPEEKILEAARELINSSKSWKQNKAQYKGGVRVYSHGKGPNDGAPWFCRVSTHDKDDVTFDEFWKYLGNDKAENEKEYDKIDSCA